MRKENNIILEINKKDECNISPLLYSLDNNNSEIFNSLINYAEVNNILLKIDEKDSKPWFRTIQRGNIEMIKLLKYAKKK